MGSPRECTRILGLESFRVERVEWEGDTPDAAVCVWIERRGIEQLPKRCEVMDADVAAVQAHIKAHA